MEIRDRIKAIMEKENMIAGTFADSIGVQQSTLSHVINGRNRPSLDVIMKIHQRYNYINLEWLLYGKGEMMNGDSTFYPDNYPSLFDQAAEKSTEDTEVFKNRREIALGTPINDTKPPVIQEIKYVEKPPRKITEIRIFFDDNTYETFRGEK